MNNLVIQKILMPKHILLPNGVVSRSAAEVTQRRPMSKTTKAIKNECTYIICRLMVLTLLNSSFHLKYFGKKTWNKPSVIKMKPVNLSSSSI